MGLFMAVMVVFALGDMLARILDDHDDDERCC